MSETAFLDEVAQFLRDSLQPDPSTQKNNLIRLEQLKAPATLHYFARVLALVLVPEPSLIGVEVPAQDPPPEIRQAAGLALKRLLQTMYGQAGNLLSFSGGNGKQEMENIQIMKKALLVGLGAPLRPVRAACSDCISAYFKKAARFFKGSSTSTEEEMRALPDEPEGYSPLNQWSELPGELFTMGQRAATSDSRDENTLIGLATCVSMLTEDLSDELMLPSYEDMRTPLLNLIAGILIETTNFKVLEETVQAVSNVIRIVQADTGGVTDADFDTEDVLEPPKSAEDSEKLARMLFPKLLNILSHFLDPLASEMEQCETSGSALPTQHVVAEKLEEADKLLSVIFGCLEKVCLIAGLIGDAVGQLLRYTLVSLQFSEALPLSAGAACGFLNELLSVGNDFSLDREDPFMQSIIQAAPRLMLPLLNALRMTDFDYDQLHQTEDSHEEDNMNDVDFFGLTMIKLQREEMSGMVLGDKTAAGEKSGLDRDDQPAVPEAVGSVLRMNVLNVLQNISTWFPTATVTDLIPNIGKVLGQGQELAGSGSTWGKDAIIGVEAAALALGSMIEESFWNIVDQAEKTGYSPSDICGTLVAILDSGSSSNGSGSTPTPPVVRVAILDAFQKIASGYLEDIPSDLRDRISVQGNYLDLTMVTSVLYRHSTSTNKLCQRTALHGLGELVLSWYERAQRDQQDGDSGDEDELMTESDDDHGEGGFSSRDKNQIQHPSQGQRLSVEQLSSLFGLVENIPNYQLRARSSLYKLLGGLSERNEDHHWLNDKENHSKLVPKMLEWLEWCGKDRSRFYESAAVMCVVTDIVTAWKDAGEDGSDVQLLPYVKTLATHSLSVMTQLSQVYQEAGGRNTAVEADIPMVQMVTKSAVDLLAEVVETITNILEHIRDGTSINATSEGSLGKITSESLEEMLAFIYSPDLVAFLALDVLSPQSSIEKLLRYSVVGFLGDYVRCVPLEFLLENNLGDRAAQALGLKSSDQLAKEGTILHSLAHVFVTQCREFDIQIHHKGVTNSLWGLFHIVMKLTGGDRILRQGSYDATTVEAIIHPEWRNGIDPIMLMTNLFLVNDSLGEYFEIRLNAGILYTQLAALFPSTAARDGQFLESLEYVAWVVKSLRDEYELYTCLTSLARALGQDTISSSIFNSAPQQKIEAFKYIAGCALKVKDLCRSDYRDGAQSTWAPIVGVLKQQGGAALGNMLKKKEIKALNGLYPS